MDSNLQIISGKYRGRKLALPAAARPTQNRARIALFNILNAEITGEPLTVWDAFGGSGAVGLEFISRDWANTAIFTDTSPESIKTINKNARDFAGNIIISRRDAFSAVGEYGARSDVIFIDPPFNDPELGASMVNKLTRVAKSGAIIIWEMENNQLEQEISENDFEIIADRSYGRIRFLILRKI